MSTIRLRSRPAVAVPAAARARAVPGLTAAVLAVCLAHPPAAAEPVAHAPGVEGHWAVTEDSLRIWYETEGQGVPILLVAGGPGGSHNAFHATHRGFARHGLLVYLDNRGRGRSDRGRGPRPYSLDNDLKDIEAVRRALGAETIVLYGRSYGGMVAQAYAIAHPEHLRGVIISNSLDGADSWQRYNIEGVKSFYQIQDPERWDAIVKLHGAGFTTSQDTLANLFSNLAALYNYTPANDVLYRARTHIFFRDDSLAAVSVQVYRAMLGPDPEWTVGGTLAGVELAEKLRTVRVPALVLAGRHDRITPVVVQEKIARAIPGSQLVIFEQSGHRPEFEEAERWNAVIDSFLDRVLK